MGEGAYSLLVWPQHGGSSQELYRTVKDGRRFSRDFRRSDSRAHLVQGERKYSTGEV